MYDNTCIIKVLLCVISKLFLSIISYIKFCFPRYTFFFIYVNSRILRGQTSIDLCSQIYGVSSTPSHSFWCWKHFTFWFYSNPLFFSKCHLWEERLSACNQHIDKHQQNDNHIQMIPRYMQIICQLVPKPYLTGYRHY